MQKPPTEMGLYILTQRGRNHESPSRGVWSGVHWNIEEESPMANDEAREWGQYTSRIGPLREGDGE